MKLNIDNYKIFLKENISKNVVPSNKKILITGSSGFIGNYLVNCFINVFSEKNLKVYGIDRIGLNIKHKKKIYKNGSHSIELNGPYEITSKNIQVAGDPSSAAFFVVGALITPNSNIVLENVLLNPTRIAYIKVLKKMGGNIKIKKTKKISGEDCGSIHVKYSKLRGIKIKKSLSPLLIDEYPILSIAACFAKGNTVMEGLDELRHKESDRIKSIVYNLTKLGIEVKNFGEDIYIRGVEKFTKKICKIKSFDDHRIACSFMILKILNDKIKIDNEKCVSISYPNFKKDLKKIITIY